MEFDYHHSAIRSMKSDIDEIIIDFDLSNESYATFSLEQASLFIMLSEERRDEILDMVIVKIEEINTENFEESYEIYENVKDIPPELLMEKHAVSRWTSTEFAISQIHQHTSYIFPTLEIGPGDGYWTNKLLGGEPLYLVDRFQEFLDMTKKQYKILQQRRLRSYITTGTDLSMLPQNQFGFVFSWDLFDRLPIGTITEYLQSIYDVMRPGGRFVFNFCNCDDWKHVEKITQLQLFNTEQALTKALLDIGYDIDIISEDNNVRCMIMVSKPGKLITIRTSPCMGKIIDSRSVNLN